MAPAELHRARDPFFSTRSGSAGLGLSAVEASAGTGKTFALTALTVRGVVLDGLRTDQLLVVTFTRAAAAELRGRIRAGLRDAAVALREAVDAPVLLHEFDRFLWDVVHPGHDIDGPIEPGRTLRGGSHELAILHTPGHSPGCCCFYDEASGLVVSGDTLFCGGPGATGRVYSDEATILASIRDVLLRLPDHTVVHTGHGDTTTIGDERDSVLERLAELGLA